MVVVEAFLALQLQPASRFVVVMAASSSCAGQQALDALLSIVQAAESDFKLWETDAVAADLAAAEPGQDKKQSERSDTEPSISDHRMEAEDTEIAEVGMKLQAEDKLSDQSEVDETSWYRKAGGDGDEDEDRGEDGDEAGDVEDEDLHDEDTVEFLRQPHPPWTVRPNKRGRSSNLTEEELAGLRHERASAELANMSWEERGPDGPNRPEHWRGQKLRQGKEGGKVRYSNRGGKHREMYAELARQGKLKPTKGGKGKSKSTKDGKGTSKSSKGGQGQGSS